MHHGVSALLESSAMDEEHARCNCIQSDYPYKNMVDVVGRCCRMGVTQAQSGGGKRLLRILDAVQVKRISLAKTLNRKRALYC